MKGALGVLLVGGGVFTLIALFNGTLKFPLGNINLLGSTLGNNPYAMGGSQFTGLQLAPKSGTSVTGRKFTQPDSNGNCGQGYYLSRLASGRGICLQGPPP